MLLLLKKLKKALIGTLHDSFMKPTTQTPHSQAEKPLFVKTEKKNTSK